MPTTRRVCMCVKCQLIRENGPIVHIDDFVVRVNLFHSVSFSL